MNPSRLRYFCVLCVLAWMFPAAHLQAQSPGPPPNATLREIHEYYQRMGQPVPENLIRDYIQRKKAEAGRPFGNVDTGDLEKERKEKIEALRRREAAANPPGLRDELRARIRTRTFWKAGDPPLKPKKSFEGFVLDDENLEREIFEAIQADALLARKLVPLRREKAEIEKRILALPPIDRTKPYIAGTRRGPEIEMDALNVKYAEALAAEHRVESIVYDLTRNMDVRNIRVFACLLWEPGEYTTDNGDAGHQCLRESMRGRIGEYVTFGVLDLEKRPRSEVEWREWWLNNRWKWGWSYEVEPIIDTKEFPTPEESGFAPKAAAPPPPPPLEPASPIPPPVPPPVVADRAQPKDGNLLAYLIAGGVALVLAAIVYLAKSRRG